LAVVAVYKNVVEFEGQRSPGTKNEKVLSHHHWQWYGVRSKQQQTIPLRGRPAVTDYTGGKISACCLVMIINLN